MSKQLMFQKAAKHYQAACAHGKPYQTASVHIECTVHINDVALAAGDSLIHVYADDTILYISGP